MTKSKQLAITYSTGSGSHNRNFKTQKKIRSCSSKPNQTKADSQGHSRTRRVFRNSDCFSWKNEQKSQKPRKFANCSDCSRRNTPISEKHPFFGNRLANRPLFGLVCWNDLKKHGTENVSIAQKGFLYEIHTSSCDHWQSKRHDQKDHEGIRCGIWR